MVTMVKKIFVFLIATTLVMQTGCGLSTNTDIDKTSEISDQSIISSDTDLTDSADENIIDFGKKKLKINISGIVKANVSSSKDAITIKTDNEVITCSNSNISFNNINFWKSFYNGYSYMESEIDEFKVYCLYKHKHDIKALIDVGTKDMLSMDIQTKEDINEDNIENNLKKYVISILQISRYDNE